MAVIAAPEGTGLCAPPGSAADSPSAALGSFVHVNRLQHELRASGSLPAAGIAQGCMPGPAGPLTRSISFRRIRALQPDASPSRNRRNAGTCGEWNVQIIRAKKWQNRRFWGSLSGGVAGGGRKSVRVSPDPGGVQKFSHGRNQSRKVRGCCAHEPPGRARRVSVALTASRACVCASSAAPASASRSSTASAMRVTAPASEPASGCSAK